MTDRELELLLNHLGAAVAYPATPPLADAVAARIGEHAPPVPRAHRARVWWWRAAAVAAIAVTVTLVALPGARDAVADLFTVGSVGIVQSTELPDAEVVRSLGDEVTLREAGELAGFDVLAPPGDEPDAVFLDRTGAGTVVTLAYGEGPRLRALITELDGTWSRLVAEKTVGSGTTITAVSVGGAAGLWIEGEPHVLVLRDGAGEIHEDEARLVGDTLVFTRDGVTVRIEADAPLEDVIRIAEALEPLGS